jgi:hypothetical protein
LGVSTLELLCDFAVGDSYIFLQAFRGSFSLDHANALSSVSLSPQYARRTSSPSCRFLQRSLIQKPAQRKKLYKSNSSHTPYPTVPGSFQRMHSSGSAHSQATDSTRAQSWRIAQRSVAVILDGNGMYLGALKPTT